MTVALRSEIQFTPTGLSLPADLSFDEWADYGERLFAMERGVMWAIGDWWRFGEHRYGERAAQALDSRYSFQTLANAGYVAGAVETSRRREVLSYSHHAEVAALPTEEQDYWLDAAESGEWSRNELRARIKRGTTDDAPIDEPESDTYQTLAAAIETLNALRSHDPEQLGASVPASKRDSVSKALDKAGLYLGRVVYSIRQEESRESRDAAA